MTGGLPSAQQADAALPLNENEPGAFEAELGETGLDAAAAANQFEQSQLKTHEMQAVLARAAEAGAFDGAAARLPADEAALLRVLAMLESAKDRLDQVRLRS